MRGNLKRRLHRGAMLLLVLAVPLLAASCVYDGHYHGHCHGPGAVGAFFVGSLIWAATRC